MDFEFLKQFTEYKDGRIEIERGVKPHPQIDHILKKMINIFGEYYIHEYDKTLWVLKREFNKYIFKRTNEKIPNFFEWVIKYDECSGGYIILYKNIVFFKIPKDMTYNLDPYSFLNYLIYKFHKNKNTLYEILNLFDNDVRNKFIELDILNI